MMIFLDLIDPWILLPTGATAKILGWCENDEAMGNKKMHDAVTAMRIATGLTTMTERMINDLLCDKS